MNKKQNNILQAGSLPELLAAMVLSGLVLFFAYEGASLLRKRLGLSLQQEQWQLLQAHATTERLMSQADSVIISGQFLLFYSSGIPSDTLYIDGSSVGYQKNGTDELLFPEAILTLKRLTVSTSGIVKYVDVFLPDAGKDTLHLHYSAGSCNYIEALHGRMEKY